MDEHQSNLSADVEDIPETTEEISAPIEDTIEKVNDEDDTQLEKPKKPRSEKQKEAFAKAQMALRAKRELKKKEKEAAPKKPRGRPPKSKSTFNEDEMGPKKPKKTKVTFEQSETESEEEDSDVDESGLSGTRNSTLIPL